MALSNTTMENKEKILDKLKKLIALQEGAEQISSINEAANAAEKIQTILIKYNLELSDALGHKSKDVKIGILGVKIKVEDLGYDKRQGSWLSVLANGITRYNFGELVQNYSYNGLDTFHVLAAEQNLLVIEYLIRSLASQIKSLERQEYSNHRHEQRGAFRRRFLMGAALGVTAKLREQMEYQQRNTEGVTALVLFNKEALQTKMNEEYPEIEPSKTSTKMADGSNAAALGYIKGKSLDINKGVEGSTNTKQLK